MNFARHFLVGIFIAIVFTGGARAEDRRIVSHDGVEIAYSVQGVGEPILVFVHGWSCDQSYWREQIDPFSRHHRVIAVDLAGHGASGTNREAWSIPAFGADVAAVVDAAADKSESIILIGHSMGGSVILEAAALLEDRVIGLVGVDTYQNVEMVLTAEQVEGFLAPFLADFAGTTGEFVRDMFREDADAALVKRIIEDIGSASPEVGVAATRASFLYRPTETLRALNVPIIGINSDLYPVNVEAFERHTSSSFRISIMAYTGHFLMLEKPIAFNDMLAIAVERFIE